MTLAFAIRRHKGKGTMAPLPGPLSESVIAPAKGPDYRQVRMGTGRKVVDLRELAFITEYRRPCPRATVAPLVWASPPEQLRRDAFAENSAWPFRLARILTSRDMNKCSLTGGQRLTKRQFHLASRLGVPEAKYQAAWPPRMPSLLGHGWRKRRERGGHHQVSSEPGINCPISPAIQFSPTGSAAEPFELITNHMYPHC